MSKKTFSQKVRKNNERAKNFEKKISAAKASIQASTTHEKLEKYLKPSKDTVIFKGLNEKVIECFHPLVGSCVFNILALEDFYTEFKYRGETVKIRFMKPVYPCSPNNLLAYAKNEYRERVKDAESAKFVLERLSKCSDNPFLATFFVECNGIISMSYVTENLQDPYKRFLVEIETTDVIRMRKNEKNIASKKNRNDRDEAELDKMKHFEETLIIGGLATYVVQYIVGCYLDGENLPKFDISESDLVPTPKAPRSSHASSAPKEPTGKDPNNCVAYIYYDCNDGSVSISGSRSYGMRWWIVSGHKRHYTSGKVIDVAPYIKGDKDDPDAQRALKVFTETHQRIQCYKLVKR